MKIRQQLEELCKKDLIPYARPVEYEFSTELPKTKLGKIDYRTLEKMANGDEEKEPSEIAKEESAPDE